MSQIVFDLDCVDDRRMLNMTTEIETLGTHQDHRTGCATSMTRSCGQLQDATLDILEHTGVKFPSERPSRCWRSMGPRWISKPRWCASRGIWCSGHEERAASLQGRRHGTPFYDFHLGDGCTYFTTDGCGVETIDLETRQRRPSCKEDVAHDGPGGRLPARASRSTGRWSARRSTAAPRRCTIWMRASATRSSTCRARPSWARPTPATPWRCPP